MKIRPVRAELFHADRRTDGRTERHDEALRSFANAPKKRKKIFWFTRYNKVFSFKEKAFEIIVIHGNKQINNRLRSEEYLFYSDK